MVLAFNDIYIEGFFLGLFGFSFMEDLYFLNSNGIQWGRRGILCPSGR